MADDTPPAYYVTTLDRLGQALLTGGALAGPIATSLVVAGGERSPIVLGLGWLVAALLAMLGTVAVAGPVWLALHRRDRRGPGSAALAAGSLTLLVCTLSQVAGSSGGDYRWASAVATSGLIALVAAAIGVAMQQVAYRRLM